MDLITLNKQLKQSVFKQDLYIVSKLLDAGAEANLRVNVDAGNLLHHTTCPKIASLLISRGANVNARNRFRLTPLFEAVKHKNLKLAEVLLKNGADVSATENNSNDTLLHKAASLQDPDMIKLLLEYDCDVHRSNSSGLTPLHQALTSFLETNGINVIRYLLEKGADPNLCNEKYEGAIHLVLKSSNCTPDLIEMLCHCRADIDKKDREGNTGLHIAVTTNKVELVEAILQYKPNILVYNIDGMHALHLAIFEHRQLAIVKAILNYSRKINIFDMDNFTCPVEASVVKSLRSGKYINIESNYLKITPLNLSFGHGVPETNVISELLLHGANLIKKIDFKPSQFCSKCVSDSKCDKCSNISQIVRELFVKYSLLNPYCDENYLVSSPDFHLIKEYVQKCQNELFLIQEKLGTSSNLYQIFYFQEFDVPLQIHVANNLMKLCLYDSHSFLIYRDVLWRRLQRCDLLNLLSINEVYAIKTHDKSKINLDWASICRLAQYLSDSDLFEFTCAYFCKTTSVENEFDKMKLFSEHLKCVPYNFNIAHSLPLSQMTKNELKEKNKEHLEDTISKHYCQLCGISDIVEIKFGIHVDIECSSILLYAVQNNWKVEVIEYILNAGVSVQLVNEQFDNCLHIAARNPMCEINVLKTLLKYSFKVDIFSFNSPVPLNVVKSLKFGNFISVSNSKKITPLHYATQMSFQRGKVDVVRELLLYGADIVAKDSEDISPLTYVVSKAMNVSLYDSQFGITKELLQLFIKFCAIKRDSNIAIFNNIQSCLKNFATDFVIKCQEELFLLGKEIIDDSYLTSYKIFPCEKNNKNCVLSCFPEKIINIYNKYPIYKDILVSKLCLSDLLKVIDLQQINIRLFRNFNTHTNSTSIYSHIFEYLNNDDKMNFIIAFCEIPETKKRVCKSHPTSPKRWRKD